MLWVYMHIYMYLFFSLMYEIKCSIETSTFPLYNNWASFYVTSCLSITFLTAEF